MINFLVFQILFQFKISSAPVYILFTCNYIFFLLLFPQQVTWAGFDRLELEQSMVKHVLLLGYLNGFQVLDVEDASSYSELVSKRDGPVSFLQMQPFPIGTDGQEGDRKSHPLLLVVAGDNSSSNIQNRAHLGGLGRDGNMETQTGNCVNSVTAVRFYSLKSHSYVHTLRFRSTVCMIRCSSRIVAVGLATQVCCGFSNAFCNDLTYFSVIKIN